MENSRNLRPYRRSKNPKSNKSTILSNILFSIQSCRTLRRRSHNTVLPFSRKRPRIIPRAPYPARSPERAFLLQAWFQNQSAASSDPSHPSKDPALIGQRTKRAGRSDQATHKDRSAASQNRTKNAGALRTIGGFLK